MHNTKPSPDHSHIPLGSTYDERGNELTYKNSGHWWERTYDERNNELTYKSNDGYSYERTYDEHGNELTYKSNDGYWWEHTYDERGNELTYKNSGGFSHQRTYDARNNELTYKNSYDRRYERTYDMRNNELTYTDHTGRWVALAADDLYTLRYNAQTGIYWAGCRKLTHKAALAHWNPETSKSPRAALFHATITNHTTNHETH